MNTDLVYNLDEIDGHDFEEVMAVVFRRLGFHAERGRLTNDEGRDLILRKAGEIVVVECKHQKAPIGRPIVQKLHSATLTYPGAKEGWIVTTSSFSPHALAYVSDKLEKADTIRIQLWDYQRLISEARNVGVFFVSSVQGTEVFFHIPSHSQQDCKGIIETYNVIHYRFYLHTIQVLAFLIN